MHLRFSVLARNRTFSKAMRLVRSKLQPLLDEFATVVLEYPISEAILVGITDNKGPNYFEEVVNNDGFFQVLAGCCERGTNQQLAEDVFDILLRAVRLCPLARPDHDKFESLFARLRPLVLGEKKPLE